MPHGGLTFWTFFPYRTDECHELDAGNKLLNERSSALWDNFVSETFIEEDWRWNFRMSRTSLYKLADELRVNPNTCGRANSIWIRIRVDVETLESTKKKLWIRKYPDTFGRGLNHRVDGPISKLFVGICIQRNDLLFAFIILGLQPRKRWNFSCQKIPPEIGS